MSNKKKCTHFDQIQPYAVSSDGCQDCLINDGTWVHLRTCLTCGKVGCCDTSANKHASKHFQESGHSIIFIGLLKSENLTKGIVYCYIDDFSFQIG